MTIFYDIKQDSNGDLEIGAGGDFLVSESDKMHINDIIVSEQGDWKLQPIVGVGIQKYLNGNINRQEMQREITIQLERDGYIVENIDIKVNGDNITLDPKAFRE